MNIDNIKNHLKINLLAYLGILAGLMGAFASYDVYFRAREVHTLQIVILANSPLVQVDKSIANDIKVLYQDKPISDLLLVQVLVENKGNRPIRESDYSKPITFVFPAQAKLIEVSVLESKPTYLGMGFTNTENTVTLSPVLLNSDDKFEIRFLVANIQSTSGEQPFDVEMRIAEIRAVDVQVVKAIDANNAERQKGVILLSPSFLSKPVEFPIVAILWGLLGAASSLVFQFTSKRLHPNKAKIINRLLIGAIIGSIGYIVMVVGLAVFSYETTPFIENLIVLSTFFFGFSDALYSSVIKVVSAKVDIEK